MEERDDIYLVSLSAEMHNAFYKYITCGAYDTVTSITQILFCVMAGEKTVALEKWVREPNATF
jgi:hypothetical protein